MRPDQSWRPAASLDTLRRRARVLDTIRTFFRGRGVWEVATPYLSRFAATDPHLTSLVTRTAAGGALYLHTSPEFPMKRLLAAGSGDIWQCCRVFRDGEAGRRHNPEFSLVEWYRIGFNAQALMDEVAALIQAVGGPAGTPVHYTYAQAFAHYLGLDPFSADNAALERCARQRGLQAGPLTRDQWLDLLFSEAVSKQFPEGRIVFVHRFPADQAALARLSPGDPATAERFECFIGPLELANGYHELADAKEQRARLRRDNRRRADAGKREMPPDEYLLAALGSGLPECSGVALGLDRLLMAVMGKEHIDEVLAFPLSRA